LIIEKRDPPRLAASRREAGHWFFLPVATATALSIFITELALKNMFARNRPPGAMLTDYSFPSGHATFAWALAVVLTAKEPRARYFFFLLAFLISLSRIYLGVHYPADVAAGSIIGLSIGYFSLWVERKVIFYRIRKKK
jgi:undecaprenyl-diphosphatase